MTMLTSLFDPQEHAPIDTLPDKEQLLVLDLRQILEYAHQIEGVDKPIVRELAEALYLFRHHACQINKRMYLFNEHGLFDGHKFTLTGYELLNEHLFNEGYGVALLQNNTLDIDTFHLQRVINHLEALLIDENAFRQAMGDPDACRIQCYWYTSEYLLIHIH